MSEPFLRALQRLHAIPQTGLTYSRDPYDLERFTEIRELSEQCLSTLLDVARSAVASHYALDLDYRTPKVDVRTAV
jgi:hypothetical protein